MIRGSWASFRPQSPAGRPSTLLWLQHSPSSAPAQPPACAGMLCPLPSISPPSQDFLALDVHEN